MHIRFDESLPALADSVATQLGEEALARGVVLRDATGRLAFFASTALEPAVADPLVQRLRTVLGPYARADRLVAGADEPGARQVLNDPTALWVATAGRRVRLVDRRLVGADWLRAPAAAAAPPPRFVFASLKGGVGRSTALAVVAADLAARGLRVLGIDLDLEAPGLGPMLLDQGTLPDFGVLDALVENGITGLDPAFRADMVGNSDLTGGIGRIDIIPALGRRSLANPGDVLAKIARAYVEDVGPGGEVATILDQVRALVEAFADRDRYDAILVDARAGLHETSASALLGLGAEVFLFGLDERQTWQSFEALFGHLARFIDPAVSALGWLDRLTLVQGKALGPEQQAGFAQRCRTLFTALRSPLPAVAPVAASADFKDIPWNEDVPDSEVLPEENPFPRDPVAVLEDPRFRNFDAVAQPHLLTSAVYQGAFGQLLAAVDAVLGSNRKTGA